MQRRSLADIIMDKIREKEQGEARMAAGDDEDDDGMPTLPPKVSDFDSPATAVPLRSSPAADPAVILETSKAKRAA